jgi:hypothetical protein
MQTACPQPCKREKSEAGSPSRPGRGDGSRKGAKPRSRTIVILDRRASSHSTWRPVTPTKTNRVRTSMANGTWARRSGNAQPPSRGSKSARDSLKTLGAPPGAMAKTLRPARPRWPEPADSGTPRGERTAVNDRPRAADAILAQFDMVGEPLPGYHGESLAGLMTPPRTQRPPSPWKRPMWQHG